MGNWLFGMEIILLIGTVLYMGVALWFRRGMKPMLQQAPQMDLGVSVIVAARDEEDSIAVCLDSLLDQSYPTESYEIIIVDDGSSDDTAEIARRYEAKYKQIRFLNTETALGRSGSKKAALGLAVEQAKKEIILTTDADCLVPRGWVEAMVAAFDEDVGMAIGYAQITVLKDKLELGVAFEAVDFLQLMAGAWGSASQGRPFAAAGQNLAYRKTVFQAVGGYAQVQHRTSGDDVLLLQLIRRLGQWRVVFVLPPESWVDHPPAPSVSAFLNKRIRWASNGPYQFHLDPLFFVYLAIVFGVNFLLVVGGLLWTIGYFDGTVWVAAWLTKGLGEWLLFAKALDYFKRQSLRRYFIPWLLILPFYTVVVGILGIGGRFTWKGKKNRWGQSISTP